MTSSPNTNQPQALSDKTQKVVQAFDGLETDAKLAWFYLVYKKMGSSITPAAPAATDPELAPMLLGDYYQLSDSEQLTIMRQIVNREDSEYSRAYGALKENNQLMVWYAWAQAMGDSVVGMPNDYQPTEAMNNLLSQIEGLDFDDQISIFRTIASNMGYTDVKPIETQVQTGKTSSL
ncbi:orange carotenoid protein N-terminal domain-containing protein [Gloeocapsopsis dulcis]|uniref:Orange carotenoid protein n=1 Tax=Gloeocapsopsis dulcis AAB1 = 1H9 TaxID=1433147 RepID=A0A6N8FZ48_9CHRO|nr:orange carotenoid protein N-terminal domain-containing protein [Gloeocapsopsis dulcis]MUL37407.1 orange carotenoid protein [Gloeocapsopsis dulcis AAB1 = 1H9]WNN87383.1 orange carotenoid protein N-terminal domain-containing protein [Gloeocapsopsis dulcis]